MQAHATQDEPALANFLTVGAEELAERMLEPATMQAIYEDTTAIISRDRTAHGLYELVQNAIDDMQEVWGNLTSDSPPYACRKGCSHCCHQSVMATAPEVLLAAKFLRDNLTEKEVAGLRIRIAARANRILGLSNDERMDGRIACAFLMDDICTIYPARPLQCRGGFSEDADYCESLLVDREATQVAVAEGRLDGRYLLLPKMLYDSAQVGMAGALEKDGLNTEPLELTAAMAIALDDPNIAEKWLAGWPVFANARLEIQPSEHGDKYTTRPATGA